MEMAIGINNSIKPTFCLNPIRTRSFNSTSPFVKTQSFARSLCLNKKPLFNGRFRKNPALNSIKCSVSEVADTDTAADAAAAATGMCVCVCVLD